MNIVLNTALMVAGGPLVSAAVADRVLDLDRARARGSVKDSIIAKNVTKKSAAKRSAAMI